VAREAECDAFVRLSPDHVGLLQAVSAVLTVGSSIDGEGIAGGKKPLANAGALTPDFFLLSIGASHVLRKRLRPA
jgi:hypothetical protein